MTKLKLDEIQERLKNFANWSYSNNQIEKEYSFKDFIEAISFVNAVALESEKMDHHPDILIHSWNKVKISISTHSEGGVTEKDFPLADLIEKRYYKA
jgi:4a-hydroxytetrahydrobiopterin dehydratase